ncbi:hypothetical protein ACC758_38640, partial [Rhizobium ruizarguesonis]
MPGVSLEYFLSIAFGNLTLFGSAKDVKWNDFRAKFCGADAAAAEKVDEADVTATSEKEPAKPTTAAP